MEHLSQIIRTAKEFQGMIEALDPYTVRALKANNCINAAIHTYKTLLKTATYHHNVPQTY